MHQKAHHSALAEGPLHFFCVISCWQNVTFYEGLIEMPSFQCIGGGSVPPPISCRTLGWAARRKARRLALAEAWMQFSVLFLAYCVWENALQG